MKRGVISLLFVCTVLMGTVLPISTHTYIAHAQRVNALPNSTPQQTPTISAPTPATQQAGTPQTSSWFNWWPSVESVALLIPRTLVYLTGGILFLTGKLFDKLIEISAAGFGGYLKDSFLLDAIEDVWILFRDLGQIVLIFSFVFIAMRVILGVGNNANKQLTVKVIIVALLMNFSLFFVQAALDVTNFFAYQFYRNISSLELHTADGNSQTVSVGVTERFAAAMGVSSFATVGDNSGGRLSQAYQSSGFFSAFGHGIGISLMYLGAAYAFGYGAVLLGIRILSLIAVMFLSSLAFTFLVIPKLQEYFDKWFDALWKNAIFAPILLALLWASIHMADALVARRGPNIIGGDIFAKNPGFVAEFITYALVVGFFYASVYIAKMVAGQSGGLLQFAKNMRGRTLVATPLASYVNFRQKRSAEKQTKNAQADLNDANAAAETARARLANKPNSSTLQSAYKDALAKQASVKKSLDNPVAAGKLNTVLGALATKLGAKLEKPSTEKLITAAEKKNKEERAEGAEVGKLAREVKKAAEQSQSQTEAIEREFKTQHENLDRQITNSQKAFGQKNSEAASLEAIIKQDKAHPNQDELITLPDGTKMSRREVVQENMNRQKQIIDQAKKASDQLAVLMKQKTEAIDSIRGSFEKEAERKFSLEAETRQQQESLLKTLGDTMGKKMSPVAMTEAMRVASLQDKDYKREQSSSSRQERERELRDTLKSLKTEKKEGEKK